MTTTNKQRAYEQRKIESGARRIPGGMLTPEGAAALDKLTASMSKTEAINRALIALAKAENN